MKFVSLFAGIGGFDLGLERAGMECVGQVEINEFCQAVLAKHWPHVKRIGDIRNVHGDEFGTVDLICGGFPCQPFSTAGKRRGEEDNRFLWPEMVRVIATIRPAWIIGENVAGIINMALDKVHSDLESIGYTVQSFIIPACALNAPHRRDRVWIVANRNGGSRSAEPWQQQEERAALVDPGCAGNVADTSGSGLQRREQRGASCESTGPSRSVAEFCEDVPNSSGLRWGERNTNAGRSSARTGEQEEWIRLADNSWWSVEPELGRVAHGIPNRSHRLKALGNAVVPQVVEAIGRAIIQAEEGASCAQERPGEHFGSAINRQPTAAGVQCG